MTTTNQYLGASITVHVGRDTIDPEGIGSAEDVEHIEEAIMDAVRDAFPGAAVRAVSNGGRTSGMLTDGTDITHDVRCVVDDAFNAVCGTF